MPPSSNHPLTTSMSTPIATSNSTSFHSLRTLAYPPAAKNLSTVPSQDLQPNFFCGVANLCQPFDTVLRVLLPDCVVSDSMLPWTYNLASGLGIPRLYFHGTSFFARSCTSVRFFDDLPADAESFVIPDLPHRIEMLRSQMPDLRDMEPALLELFHMIQVSEVESYGAVVNSFYELEPDYADHYRTVIERKAWCVGPVSLRNKDAMDKCNRGNKNLSNDYEACLNWLDSKSCGSVVYVAFGSLCKFSSHQLREIALGLEASNRPFIWVVREVDMERMIDGYEGRIEGRGLIVRGWAPQILILNHDAVGGFVTHCGWNSSLEGISAGLPLVAWPLFAEQFFNERLIVDVLKIGVAVGVKEYTVKQVERPVIEARSVEGAVREMMGEGEEANERRRRAMLLGEMARRAIDEGGSSYEDIGKLIQELMEGRGRMLVKSEI